MFSFLKKFFGISTDTIVNDRKRLIDNVNIIRHNNKDDVYNLYEFLDYFFCYKYNEHIIATQDIRDLYKHTFKFDYIKRIRKSSVFNCEIFKKPDTLILCKFSGRRSQYLDLNQWNGIFNFIRNKKLDRVIKKIVYVSNPEITKIREKEYKFIESCGCKFNMNIDFDNGNHWTGREYIIENR